MLTNTGFCVLVHSILQMLMKTTFWVKYEPYTQIILLPIFS